MKNTEIAFYSFEQFGYSSLNIGGNGDSVEVFDLFSMQLRDKAFNYLKNLFFWQFQVTFPMYLNIGRNDDDDYDDGESSYEDYYEQHDDEKGTLIRQR